MQNGGYHEEIAHPDLAAALHLPSYRSELLYEQVSIQTCPPKAPAAEPRLGEFQPRPSMPSGRCASTCPNGTL